MGGPERKMTFCGVVAKVVIYGKIGGGALRTPYLSQKMDFCGADGGAPGWLREGSIFPPNGDQLLSGDGERGWGKHIFRSQDGKCPLSPFFPHLYPFFP